MDCKKIMELRDDYLDGRLSPEETHSIRQHGDQCPSCRRALQHDAEIKQVLADMPVPPPSADFAPRVLAAARKTHQTRQQKRVTGWGAALAAGIALWVMVGLPGKTPLPPQERLAAVTLQLHEQRTVNLVVNAPQDLVDADVTIQLPQQLEMVGFPNSNEIRWTTTLRKGKNLLSLPLTAKSSGSVELITHINHQKKSKTLKVEMQINDDNAADALDKLRYLG